MLVSHPQREDVHMYAPVPQESKVDDMTEACWDPSTWALPGETVVTAGSREAISIYNCSLCHLYYCKLNDQAGGWYPLNHCSTSLHVYLEPVLALATTS